MASFISPITSTTTNGATALSGDSGDIIDIHDNTAVTKKNMLKPLLN